MIPLWIFNERIFLFLNGLHSPYTDPAWLAITTLGDGLILVIVLGAFLVINPRITALGILLLLITGGALVHILKAAFDTLRPPAVLDTVHLIGPLLRAGSFPSGHAAAAVSAALAIAYYSRSRTPATVALALGALTAISRIFVGVHFPADVLAGALLAMLVFLLATVYVQPGLDSRVPDFPRFDNARFRYALFVLVGVALYALFVYAPFYADSAWTAAVVAICALLFAARGYGGSRKA